MKPFLIEKIVQPRLQIIVEDVATSASKMFMKGKVQQTSKNQNNRRYRKELWEQLFADPDYQDKLQRGTLIGGIGHPKDGIFDPEKGCLVTRNMELVSEEDVDGELEILLKHPHGMILGIYYESGVFYPVSSRGRGDSTTENDGVIDVTPGTYIYEGHDAVIDPSVKDATPDYVKEALSKKENFIKYADLVRDKITQEKVDVNFVRLVKQLAPATFKVFHESTSNFKDLSSLLESREEELTGTGTPKGTTTVIVNNKIIEDLHTNLTDMQEKLDKVLKQSIKPESIQTNESVDDISKNKQKIESMSDVAKTPQQLQEELAEANKKLQLSESTGKLTAMTEKFEAAKKILDGSEKKVLSLGTELSEEKKKNQIETKRFDACKLLLGESLKKAKNFVFENAELKSKLEAAYKIIEGQLIQMESLQKSGIGKVIATEVAKFPEALKEKARKSFSECKTSDSVVRMSESMLSFYNAMGDRTLPFNQDESAREEKNNNAGKRPKIEERSGDDLMDAINRKLEKSDKALEEQEKMRPISSVIV